MIYYKTDEEIELIRERCLIVSKTLALAASLLKPGISGKELDAKAEEFIRDHNGDPAFKGYGGFPASLCISKNESVVHGIPEYTPFQEGDIVSIDCGVEKNGFFGDSAFTFAIGEIPSEVMALLVRTQESLYKGIEVATIGNRIGDVSHAIQEHAEGPLSYGVVRDLVGHGIGRSLHESPEVPNFGKRGRGTMLKEGLVIAIEPMVNLGDRKIKQHSDGWTITSIDKSPSAHYEHTIAVRKDKADILSDHSFLKEAIKNNPHLAEIC